MLLSSLCRGRLELGLLLAGSAGRGSSRPLVLPAPFTPPCPGILLAHGEDRTVVLPAVPSMARLLVLSCLCCLPRCPPCCQPVPDPQHFQGRFCSIWVK